MNNDKAKLAGLVDGAADEVYRRLLSTGGATIGAPGSGAELDEDDVAVRELVDVGIAYRTGEDDGLLRPVSLSSALRTLLERRHRELTRQHTQFADGWRLLAQHLPGVAESSGVGGATSGGGVWLLTDIKEITTVAADLWRAPAKELRGTETGEFPTKPTSGRVMTPSRDAVGRGVRFRMIYQSDYRTTPWGGAIIEQSLAAGELVRLRQQVPLKLVHVDDKAALVAVDRSARAALFVRSPALLALIAEWFDAMWSDAASVAVGDVEESGLTADQKRVLEQMHVGHADEAIARQLNISVRTVRRHVTAIYDKLGVSSRSRFAAGVAAAKKGWL